MLVLGALFFVVVSVLVHYLFLVLIDSLVRAIVCGLAIIHVVGRTIWHC